ncbi:MAG TPA: hypothetical protein VIL29_00585, partial [Pseudothermotoga sp.]
MKKLFVILGILLAFVVFAEEVIKIGAIFPLTGPAAATGVKIKYAIEVAQEIINGEHPEIELLLGKSAGLPNLNGAK